MTFIEASTLLTVLFTCVITGVNVLMWLSSHRAIALQTNNNYSSNHQALIDGHRELFMGLLHQPNLLKKFANANSIDADEWELKIVSAFFINHIFSHYLNFSNRTTDEAYLQGFKDDAIKMFSFPTIRKHWRYSKVGYSPQFQKFVEEELIAPTTAEPSLFPVVA